MMVKYGIVMVRNGMVMVRYGMVMVRLIILVAMNVGKGAPDHIIM